MAESVYIVDDHSRARRCTTLARRLNQTAKDLYGKTNANVAVFVRSDQGREYRYASTVPGVDGVMDLVGYLPRELNLVEKIQRDWDTLDLGERTSVELSALHQQFELALEGIRVARANLG